MGQRKTHLSKLEYSTDYDGVLANAGTATWTEIPELKIDQEGASLFGEESQGKPNINGVAGQAGAIATAAYPVRVDDTDTFLAALKTAADAGTKVYFRETLGAEDPEIWGPCLVMVNRAKQQFPGFVLSVINAGASSATTEGALQIQV